MEMTLRRLGLSYFGPVLKNMGLPLGILMLVAMMVLPLPAVLLDIFFTSNILLSLLPTAREPPASPGRVAITELALCPQRLESKVEIAQPRPNDGIGKAILVSHPE